ncbi:MAG: NADH-quinone oxidoreductase subunit NuoH [Deltaproteobacteria bacterium]|jgi:NADH-quinone oxidoreductase subunit H|nr:NADH-quinone oxidoreductase subunit NuoH [Deltaproteobacteria bacterium]
MELSKISVLSLVELVVACLLVIALMVANAIVMVYAERKGAGFIQRRPGPYEVGPWGILQPVADSMKLLAKQLFVPANVDFLLYFLAPVLAFLPVLLLFLPIPFGPYLTALKVPDGVVLILAFAGFGLLANLLAGYSSNNKYGILGAGRAVAQGVAYEIPMILALLAVVFQTGSMNLSDIAEAQGSAPWRWNFLCQPLAFFIYLVTLVAETNRAPFDLPEGESELTAGFHTEYSGMGFALFFLSEYANMLLVSFVCATFFLGGYKGPILDGFWWTFIKAYAVMAFIVWIRWTFPRVRFDQLLNINWKWLLPLSILNLWITAVIIKLV